jgi:hypothetical protein
MLDTHSWYLVYGCYGSLLEAHLCDIGIYLRYILGIWLHMYETHSLVLG